MFILAMQLGSEAMRPSLAADRWLSLSAPETLIAEIKREAKRINIEITSKIFQLGYFLSSKAMSSFFASIYVRFDFRLHASMYGIL